jgi:hypothetical protein
MRILQETMVTLHEAAQTFPSNRAGKKMNFSTILRWGLNGVLAIDGRRVKLEMARVGGRWLTSKEALQRFSAALAPTNEGDEIRTPTSRKRESAAAKKKLQELGV